MSRHLKENLAEKCMNIKPSIAITTVICFTILMALYISLVKTKEKEVELKGKEIELKAKEVELKAKEVEALTISRTETRDGFTICVQTIGQSIKSATVKDAEDACNKGLAKQNSK